MVIFSAWSRGYPYPNLRKYSRAWWGRRALWQERWHKTAAARRCRHRNRKSRYMRRKRFRQLLRWRTWKKCQPYLRDPPDKHIAHFQRPLPYDRYCAAAHCKVSGTFHVDTAAKLCFAVFNLCIAVHGECCFAFDNNGTAFIVCTTILNSFTIHGEYTIRSKIHCTAVVVSFTVSNEPTIHNELTTAGYVYSTTIASVSLQFSMIPLSRISVPPDTSIPLFCFFRRSCRQCRCP